MQSVQPHIMFPKPIGAYQLNNLALDGTTTKCAFITIVPYTGSIEEVVVRTRLVTTAQTLKVSLQALSAGVPDGTILGSGTAYGTITTPASATSYSVALSSPLSVTIGTSIAVVVEWDATAGDLGMASAIGEVCNNFYTATYASGSYTIVSPGEVPLVGLKYSDGFHGGSTWPMYNVAATTFNSGSSPNEIGIYIDAPVSLEAMGGTAYVNLTGAAELILYDADDNAIRTVSMSPDNRWSATMGFHYHYFANQIMRRGEVYRLAVKPTTATDVLLMEYTFPAAMTGILNSLSGGANIYRTSRTGAGAWTEVNYMRPVISLFSGGFDDGGIISHPGMGGGFKG